ncbi:hypothetical protein GGR50DRAFT_235668 [Xylaria sp. CBS 124048]|nr:hypothetical protein GGR50DRAFT_235668 [Xylaria sp. CBS 124048]
MDFIGRRRQPVTLSCFLSFSLSLSLSLLCLSVCCVSSLVSRQVSHFFFSYFAHFASPSSHLRNYHQRRTLACHALPCHAMPCYAMLCQSSPAQPSPCGDLSRQTHLKPVGPYMFLCSCFLVVSCNTVTFGGPFFFLSYYTTLPVNF